MGQTAYNDLAELAESQYDERGWTAIRTFTYDGVTGSDSTSILQDLIDGLEIQRGDDHPSGADMQADVIKATAITSSQCKVTVSYRKLSGADAEPSNTQAGLMTIGGSVHEQQTTVDRDGDDLIVDYVGSGDTNAYNIVSASDDSTAAVGPNGNPQSRAVATAQTPTTLIHFARREPDIPTEVINQFEGSVNSHEVNWNGFIAAPKTLMCTRIEAQTHDNGFSYVVEYEFQYNPDTWIFYATYTLPNNTRGTLIETSGDTTKPSLGPGDIPPDALQEPFDMYQEQDFNELSLMGENGV